MYYVHVPENENLGYILREELVDYKDRQILYLLSELETECFSLSVDVASVLGKEMVTRKDTRTAYVKGYVVKWKYKKDEQGNDISEIGPIEGPDKSAVKELIQSRSNAALVCLD